MRFLSIPIKWAAVLVCSSLIAIFGLFTLATGQVTQPTNGSTLQLRAVVTQSSGDTLASTYAISPSDTVQWTSYYDSHIASPMESDGVLELPSGYKWVSGSFSAGPNTTPQWFVSGNWTGTQPASGTVVSKVGWHQNPLAVFGSAPSASPIDFSGTGDGYRVIPYAGKLFVVNHHETNAYFNCRIATSGAACPGFGSGAYFPILQGQPLGTSAYEGFATPHRSLEHVDYANGNMYTYVTSLSQGNVKVTCVNLNTLTGCMNALTMGQDVPEFDAADSGYVDGKYRIQTLGSVGNRYYALGNSGKIYCFDTSSKTACPGQPYTLPSSPQNTRNYATTAAILDGKIFFIANFFYVSNNGGGNSGAANPKFACFDPQNNAECAGWENGFDVSTLLSGIHPVLNPDGSNKGVCTKLVCRLINGTAFTPSANLQSFVIGSLNTRYVYSEALPLGSQLGARLYSTAGSNFSQCFNFTTDALCGAPFPIDATQNPSTYGIRLDPTRPNCLWALGDSAIAKGFDALTGGACSESNTNTPTLSFEAAPVRSYACDATRQNVTGWNKIRLSPNFSWSGQTGAGVSGILVKLANENNQPLPAALSPTRHISSGAYVLDISDIPYAQYPKLKVTLEFALGAQATSGILNGVSADIHWWGDPVQTCFKAQAPQALDHCQQIASLNVKGKPTHVTAYEDDLITSTGLVQLGTMLGVGPTTISTTLRESLAPNDSTKVLQTRYDMSRLTGDLAVYGYALGGTLPGTPLGNASSVSNALPWAQRTIWTSQPSTSTANSWNTISFAWSALSSSQQAALNTKLDGTLDNEGGARLAYLQGSHSTEGSGSGQRRTRYSQVLGPVVHSSPALLPKKPQVGYSEHLYPNYFAFRRDTARANPVAFFGGNDGMLHAYNILSTGVSEAFSFIPNLLLKQAARYTDTSAVDFARNPYFVDNTPMIRDVNLASNASGNSWKTVLVNAMGRGGRGLFALDITTGGLDRVLWEYDHTTPKTQAENGDLSDLGQIQAQPPTHDVTGADNMVRMANGRWAVLAGNGIGTQKAVLYIFYLNGTAGGSQPRWQRIAVSESDPDLAFGNGLSTPRPVDIDGDGKIDWIYAGDLKGNLWRFDVRQLNDVTVTKIFTASTGQSILSAPEVKRFDGFGRCPANASLRCWMVLFGTSARDTAGQMPSPISVTSTSIPQNLYGVWDKGANGGNGWIAQDQLVTQQITTTSTVDGQVYRNVSQNPVDYETKRGWKLTLSPAELLVSNPKLQDSGNILFATTRPPGSQAALCAPTASWLTQLSPFTGSGQTPVFGGQSASVQILGGAFETPLVIRPQDLRATFDFIVTAGGALGSGTASLTPSVITKTKGVMLGRTAWREVYGAP